MSKIANAILNFAKGIANSTDSVLKIRIKQNEVKYCFGPKSSNSKNVYEGFYDNVEFYIGDMANPIELDIDPEKKNADSTVDVMDNAISTKRYQTFMQQEALERIFNVTGPKQEQMMKLMYVVIGGIAISVIMQFAIFGGT